MTFSVGDQVSPDSQSLLAPPEQAESGHHFIEDEHDPFFVGRSRRPSRKPAFGRIQPMLPATGSIDDRDGSG